MARKDGLQKCVTHHVKIHWICILTYLGFTYCQHRGPMDTQMGVYGEKFALKPRTLQNLISNLPVITLYFVFNKVTD